MARDLLNTLPDWALALVFVGGVVAVTLVGLILVTRFMAGWRSAQSVEPVLGVTAMVMTLYALVLAFVVVNLYSDYSTASGDVTLFLAAMTLAVSLLIRTHRAGVDAALVVVIAVVVGAGLLTALILQYPYSGSIAVTSDAFTRGALAQLAAPAR